MIATFSRDMQEVSNNYRLARAISGRCYIAVKFPWNGVIIDGMAYLAVKPLWHGKITRTPYWHGISDKMAYSESIVLQTGKEKAGGGYGNGA